MAAKPTVGGSNNTWGTELNEFLDVEHTAGGFHQSFTGPLVVDTTTFVVDIVNNRIGVGTASPEQLAHFYAAAGDVSLKIESGATGDNIQRVLLENDGGNNATFGLASTGGSFWPANSAIVDYNTSGPFVIAEAGTERVYVNNGGAMDVVGNFTAGTIQADNGADFGPGAVSSITVVGGIITAIS